MPCRQSLAKFLDEWVDGSGLRDKAGDCLLPTVRNGVFTETPLTQANVHQMIRRRAREVGSKTKISCHTFLATGITPSSERRAFRGGAANGRARVTPDHGLVGQEERRGGPG